MRSLGFRAAVASSALLWMSCGSRAALDDDRGCYFDSECEGNSICRQGSCNLPLLPAGGAAGAPTGNQTPGNPARGGSGSTQPIGAGGGAGFGNSGGSFGAAGTASLGGASGTNGGAGGSGNGGGGNGGGGNGGSTGNTAGFGGSSGGGGTGGSSIDGLPPLDQPTIIRILPDARAIVASPNRDLLYVAVGSNGTEYPNSIAVVDPLSALVLGAVSVGPDPDQLAISDDGTTLWAAIHGSGTVLQLDVTAIEPLPLNEYALPEAYYVTAAHQAGPMVVLPGTTESLAVSLHVDGYNPSLSGVVVLDAGVARPTLLPGYTGASRLTSGPSGYLFGYNNLHTGFGFYVIDVVSNGLYQTEYSNLISGFDTDITYADGFVFSTNGDVINVLSPAYPYHFGRFPFVGPVHPEVPSGVVWMLSGAASHAYPAELYFVLFDLLSYQPLGSVLIGDEILMPRNLVRSQSAVLGFIADAPAQGYYTLEFESGVYLMSW